MFDTIKHISAHEWEQEVIHAGKLVIVDFWADWCGPCKAMEPTMAKIAKKYQSQVRIVKVNVDDEEQLARMNSIRSIPTLLFFDGPKIVDTLVGAVPESVIVNLIGKHAK